MTPGQEALHEAARADPWAFDLPERITLAKSILGHIDCEHCAEQVRRAVAALDGQPIDDIARGLA